MSVNIERLRKLRDKGLHADTMGPREQAEFLAEHNAAAFRAVRALLDAPTATFDADHPEVLRRVESHPVRYALVRVDE